MHGFTSADGKQRAERIGRWARGVARGIRETLPATRRDLYDLDATVDLLDDDVSGLARDLDALTRDVQDIAHTVESIERTVESIERTVDALGDEFEAQLRALGERLLAADLPVRVRA
jgi:archaellum component FlaC